MCLCLTLYLYIEKLPINIQKGPAEIEEIAICKNVDQNFAPVEITEEFPPNTNSIYLSVKFKNFTENDLLKVIWTYETLSKKLSEQEFKPTIACSGYYGFNIKTSNYFPEGKYSAEVFLNSKSIKKIYFYITQ